VRAGVPRTLDAICDRVLHKEAAQHSLPIETAHEIAAALCDYVGDPAAAAPVDVPSMYDDPVTPTPEEQPEELLEAERRDEPRQEPTQPADTAATAVVDPEETMAAPSPLWDEEHAEPEPWQPPPPPPPLEDLPERPLFADHERRVPPGAPPPPPPRPAEPAAAPASGPAGGPATGSSGGNTDTGARYWPFEDPEDTGGFSGREGRSWLQLAAIVALCIAVLAAMFVAFGIGRGGDKNAPKTATSTAPATPTLTGSPIKVVKASDFDPEGDPPEENPGQVPLAIDGKPDTGWRTLTYKDDARLGGLKSGVGIVLDLGSEQEVGSVQVQLVGSPTTLELYATAPGVNGPPAELADARRLTAVTADGTTAVLRVQPSVRTRFVVVWLTSLPAVTGGFRGEIAEVTVRS
jgi:hypothetical protein